MTAAVITRNPISYPGQAQLALVEYTFSSSYATGGEVVTNEALGFSGLSTVIPQGVSTSGYQVKWTGTGLQVFKGQGGPSALHVYGATGATAGAHTLAPAGSVATDELLAVVYQPLTASGAITGAPVTLTSDTGSVLGTGTWANSGGTNTSGGVLTVITARPSDYGAGVEVANGTTLVGETIQLLVIGQN